MGKFLAMRMRGAMKRLNRKQLIETLECARQGYASLYMRFCNDMSLDGKVIAMSSRAHHINLNNMIANIGGESVDIDNQQSRC